jgi:hypothetical protein
LKDREAEYYEGVEVTYQPGRDAVLTIYDESGAERERVVLSDLAAKEDMHRVMVEKGFRKKSDEEIGRIKAERFWTAEEEKKATLQRNEELIARHRARLEEEEKKRKLEQEKRQREMVIELSQAESSQSEASVREEL